MQSIRYIFWVIRQGVVIKVTYPQNYCTFTILKIIQIGVFL